VFWASTLGEMLEKEELHIPFLTSLPLDDSGETFPYYRDIGFSDFVHRPDFS
jgi:hypothetical protein